jgi:hypothetical protein
MEALFEVLATGAVAVALSGGPQAAVPSLWHGLEG